MSGPVASRHESTANLALAFAAAAVVVMVALGTSDADGPIWITTGVLAAVAVWLGLRAGGGRPAGRALAAVVVGALVFLGFVAGTIAELA